MCSARYYQFAQPDSFITSGRLGTMGFSLPAAMGAKLAAPHREVIAIVGDGSFQMKIQELATITQEELAVKVIVMNNGYLGMVRQWQELFHEKRYSFTELKNPDFVAIARGSASVLRAWRPAPISTRRSTSCWAAKGGYVLEAVVGERGTTSSRWCRPGPGSPKSVWSKAMRDKTKQLYTISAFTDNSPGVLHRLVTTFTKRKVNIESLTVSETERHGVSRFTIVVMVDEDLIKTIVKQIDRIIEVREVYALLNEDLIFKEIALIRVNASNADDRVKVEEHAERYGARVITSNPTRWWWKLRHGG
jgi:acetolactate synthase small subunit